MLTPTGLSAEELTQRGRKVVRAHGKQILLIAQADKIFAIANRCPHEGYPLSEGTLSDGCVLTCNWHNWKFDLASGTALVGRDPVRTYSVHVREGQIFLDLSDPPAGAQKARALEGLDKALTDNDPARIAREVARLECAGYDATVALAHALRSTFARLENGMTHAHAAAADWLALAGRAPTPDQRLAAMLEPLGHLAWDTQGAGHFPYADRVERWDENAFLAAVEAEDEPRAIALMRGAVANGISYDRLGPAIGTAALAHYADFGHSAIYTLKAGQLIERVGAEAHEPILLALVRQQVKATREERLPEFRFYDKALAAWDGSGHAPLKAEDFIGVSIEGALKRTLACSGGPPRELYDALLGAAAWNLMHFDLSFDRATDNSIADNVSWLDFTHALTFANAARRICERRPRLWPRALLQLALFVGRNRGFVDAELDGAPWHVSEPRRFIAEGMATLFDHGIVEPVIACHRLKMLFALEDEINAQPDAPWIAAMSAAMNRWLNNPQKRHHGLRIAAQARDFVAREA
ncbi:MAG: Rieske 2Fe-2S domain-containing protein [Alphaproteobacteria bacterium]|nr:Rieske 2Fe-2S domain-containing protein [Alphaproteobacteria bacterium]